MIGKLFSAARDEWFLAVSIGVALLIWAAAPVIMETFAGPGRQALLFGGLFGVALGSCLAVVRHADHLAVRLGEPYGTLILTLAITVIEVLSISAMTVHTEPNPGLVRDTIFAVVMILLNGMVGISLLLGGWRHREQQFNLQGANVYLGVITPLLVLSLILPDFTISTPGPTFTIAQEDFVGFASIGLYVAFIAVQTIRHRSYFVHGELGLAGDHEIGHGAPRAVWVHGVLLVAYMAPLVYLAEQMTRPVAFLLKALHGPEALGGVVIAMLVAAPEAVGAVRAAAANQLQRSMNIFLGSVLSTIGLTIPAMIAISQWNGEKIVLGLQNANAVMLVLTLSVSVITFASGRTNVLQGAIHLVLFGAYILLIFQG